jgi:hypothetical protein
MKHPFAVIIVGSRGTGKSTLTKNILTSFPLKTRLIFDPNVEYSEGIRYYDFDKFLSETQTRTYKVFVFEEATGFIGINSPKLNLTNMLIRLRHKNNSVIFIFHSLRSIPIQIFDFVDKLFVFKTNDRPDLIKKKYADVLNSSDIEKIKNLKPYKCVQIDFF